jgi:hypothetical protein
MARIKTVVATVGLALLSTTASAQNVSYDFDKGTDFSGLKTYAWVRGVNLKDELNHERIVDAVDAQLAAKGLDKLEPSANPDVLVAYHAAFASDLQVSGSSSGLAGYRVGTLRSGSGRVGEILVGTLVIDVVDAKTGDIVWRGIARKDVDVDASPEKREKNINRAVEKLFKKYPPQG